ncbi:hypothetical protein FVR03_21760 [Pontibacter qinzhouensis]|uniref:STAS/SEC14 domain-containing protein n=1 Tax=Pontibacter qinzhouensis TaxID=2603253 RepID=A0A5C8J016_9BACT|nr:hypothetical protein [Pontibacter qinzhouensis]TXK26551.1 hypothetical protein FVR03_21760 [Pontibacter qinzhouensis]
MIIQNNLIKLEYNPVTDILNVEWPNISADLLTEVKHTLKAIVDAIKHYDVKKLLINSQQTIIGISQSEYENILKSFSQDLNATRLQMVARIESKHLKRELLVKEVSLQLKNTSNFEFQNFTTMTDAISWLEKSKINSVRPV